MTSIHHRPRLAAFICTLAVALITLIAASQSASAQGCCKTYNVLVQNTVPAACYPITVTTAWANGISGTTAHTAPGLVTLAAPNPPGCWFNLIGLTINGVPVPPPFTGATVTLGPGCTVSVGIISTGTGCITIVIF